MSAYVVERVHVLRLVTTGVHGPVGDVADGLAWYPPSWTSGPAPHPDDDPDDRDEDAEPLVRRQLREDVALDVARLLVEENLASVRYRYEDADEMVPDDPPLGDEDLRTARRMTVGEALGALDCLEYQSCEHPGWRSSEAREFCQALRRSLCAAVPGYAWP